MDTCIDFITWFGGLFDQQQYALWTRVQCSAWTAADLVIVFTLLRIGDLARAAANAPQHRVSYIVLALTVPPALCISFDASGAHVFTLEFFVTIPHFLIILYVLLFDSVFFLKMLALSGRHD